MRRASSRRFAALHRFKLDLSRFPSLITLSLTFFLATRYLSDEENRSDMSSIASILSSLSNSNGACRTSLVQCIALVMFLSDRDLFPGMYLSATCSSQLGQIDHDLSRLPLLREVKLIRLGSEISSFNENDRAHFRQVLPLLNGRKILRF